MTIVSSFFAAELLSKLRKKKKTSRVHGSTNTMVENKNKKVVFIVTRVTLAIHRWVSIATSHKRVNKGG